MNCRGKRERVNLIAGLPSQFDLGRVAVRVQLQDGWNGWRSELLYGHDVLWIANHHGRDLPFRRPQSKAPREGRQDWRVIFDRTFKVATAVFSCGIGGELAPFHGF